MRIPKVCVLGVLLVCPAAQAGTISVTDPANAMRNFGNVSVSGAPVQSSVTLTNSGTNTTVTGFTPTGQGCGEFTVSALSGGQPVSPANPATLANGESLVVAASYDPANRANDDCTFFVDQNGATSPNFRLTGDGIAPVLQVTGSPLAFAEVRWNGDASENKNFFVSNTGDEAIGNSNLQFAFQTGTHFEIAGITNPPPIFPGGTATVQVQFDPTSAGVKSDTLTVSLTNDTPTDPNATVTMSGTGTQSTVLPGASPFNVGKVVVGYAGVGLLSLANSGTASLNFSGDPTALDLAGDAAEFTFADHGCDGAAACDPVPGSLAPGGSGQFGIRCSPSVEGLRSTTLTIRSDEPASPRALTVNCTGLSPIVFSDGFEGGS